MVILLKGALWPDNGSSRTENTNYYEVLTLTQKYNENEGDQANLGYNLSD